MSASAHPVLSRTAGAVTWLTLNRPEKRNALGRELVSALADELRRAEADRSVRVVALEGAGEDFCAGADLNELERMSSASVPENLADAEVLGELFVQLRRMPKPVVAVVRGRALAGGCGLASACDLVLAAASARFGYPEVGIGFVPAMVMAILRRNLGEKRAFELVALGSVLPAAEAERIGLINRVCDDDVLEKEARSMVDELASRSGTALQISKRLLYQQDTMGFETAIRTGAAVNALARTTDDARAGVARFTGSGGSKK